MEAININDLDLGLDFNNFEPDEIDTEETINVVFVLDVSPSMLYNDAIGEMGKAFNEFIDEMKGSHLSDRLFFSIVEFADFVKVKNGFQPITALDPIQFQARGRGTALYDAVAAGLENAMDYRVRLENTGVMCKTILFIVTDGVDNSSATRPEAIKKSIDDILAEEKNAFTFTSLLFGVGHGIAFKDAKEAMGIQLMPDDPTEKSAKGMRKMISMISSSISSTSAGTAVSF